MQYLHCFGVKLSSEHWAKLLIWSNKSDQNKKSTNIVHHKEPVILYFLKEEHSQEANWIHAVVSHRV